MKTTIKGFCSALMALLLCGGAVVSSCDKEPDVGDDNQSIPFPDDAVNLSLSETSNCYVVSKDGRYQFKTVKGNSNSSVGSVASAEVLWESFGTAVTPSVGDLLEYATYKDGYIAFQTSDTFKEGNAVIAAKDATGNILWSWHIWLTDQPKGQVYYNGAGTMMDRNLGATSATPGDVGVLGLLYQWGRKDPFLGSSSIRDKVEAKSTIAWPATVKSNASNGTIAYATAHPTTFISCNSGNVDWYYTGDSTTDNSRWTTSDKEKSIYDPCPTGWRVPDGGISGVWSKASGSPSSFTGTYSSTNAGMNFSGKFGSASTIWYPASGCRLYSDGSLYNVGYIGWYWSASTDRNGANIMNFSNSGYVDPSTDSYRAYGLSVRCLQEGSISNVPSDDDSSEEIPTVPFPTVATDLSSSQTANSYIVSKTGIYKFKTVKGNSSTSVGSVSKAEVLWESFGTAVTPSVGDLLKYAVYKDGYIAFQTADAFKEGNAVIAAKDVAGNILWSWHIWMTDQPQAQVYNNDAGTMMDRNLGATSATPGDVGALGLLYQWGRKDPFLGGGSISSNRQAKSTITWPYAVESNSSTGTISYATANPTTFITCNGSNCDWYYTGSSSTDTTRWTTSGKDKSIYDPCPAGWRVPDGGENGVWSKACGLSPYFDGYPYDSTNEGMNFSGKFGSASTIWYPASGYRDYDVGSLYDVGRYGRYWSASPGNNYAYSLSFGSGGFVDPSSDYNRARGKGQSVRCLQVIDEVAGANAEE